MGGQSGTPSNLFRNPKVSWNPGWKMLNQNLMTEITAVIQFQNMWPTSASLQIFETPSCNWASGPCRWTVLAPSPNHPAWVAEMMSRGTYIFVLVYTKSDILAFSRCWRVTPLDSAPREFQGKLFPLWVVLTTIRFFILYYGAWTNNR